MSEEILRAFLVASQGNPGNAINKLHGIQISPHFKLSSSLGAYIWA